MCSQSWMRCGQGAPQEQLSVRSLDTFFAQSGLYRLRDATPPSNVRFNRCFCGDVSGMSSRAQCVQERAWWRRAWVRHVSLALVGSFHCPGSSTVLRDEVATLVATCSSEFAVDLNISRTLMVHSALNFRRLQSCNDVKHVQLCASNTLFGSQWQPNSGTTARLLAMLKMDEVLAWRRKGRGWS